MVYFSSRARDTPSRLYPEISYSGDISGYQSNQPLKARGEVPQQIEIQSKSTKSSLEVLSPVFGPTQTLTTLSSSDRLLLQLEEVLDAAGFGTLDIAKSRKRRVVDDHDFTDNV